ncbi:MAG: twin transmembrane helix small protein [Alphaproteobacteria bacterium]
MKLASSVLPVLVATALVATLGALFAGIISMVKGGAFNAKYGNKLMRARVALQATAVGLLALLLLLSTR